MSDHIYKERRADRLVHEERGAGRRITSVAATQIKDTPTVRAKAAHPDGAQKASPYGMGEPPPPGMVRRFEVPPHPVHDDPDVKKVIIHDTFADRPQRTGTLGPGTVVEEIKD